MFKWIVKIVIQSQDESLHYITTWNHFTMNNSTMNEWCESTIDLKSKTTSFQLFFARLSNVNSNNNGEVKILIEELKFVWIFPG